MATAGGPDIIEDGLVLALDAANTKSYPGTGTTWYDLSGNGDNGTLTNGPTFDSNNQGSIDFDGTNDLITTSFGSGRNVATNPFTVTAWIKADVTNANMMWVDVGGNGSNQRFYSTLINGSSRNFGIQATGWSDSQPDDTNWHHQAIVMDGSTARGYNNGVQVQTLGYTSYTLPGAIRFGGRSGYYWNGQIAKTKIYNKALTASEVLQNYNATKGRFGI